MGKVSIREERLLAELQARGQLDLREITQMFSISDSTARRMCVEMEGKGLVIRTFGGLRALHGHAQPLAAYSYLGSQEKNAEQKARIGRCASGFVENGDILFLSGGTTVQQMALALTEQIETRKLREIMILTNSIGCAEVLAPHCTVMLTGGKMRPERWDVAGFLSEQNMRNSHFDKCFVGVDGIALDGGVMAFDMDTANIDRLATAQSNTAYILADSSKFQQSFFTAYERFLPKHHVITGVELGEELQSVARNSGIELTLV